MTYEALRNTWCNDFLRTKNSLVNICGGEVLGVQVLTPQLPLLLI